MSFAPSENIKISAKDKLIVALDVENSVIAERIVAELGDLVGAFKIGLQLFTSEGQEFVRGLAEKGHKIFLDLKFHDIPNTVAKASVEAAKLGVWMFNVHTLGGAEMMRRSVSEVNDYCTSSNVRKPIMIGVTVLTSSTRSTLEEVGIGKEVEEQVVSLASLASRCGLDGVVASPLEVSGIKKALKDARFSIVTPGIRPQNGTLDDQNRVTTPGSAVLSGSDYLVVGRPITASPDMRSAALSIIDEIKGAISQQN